MIRAVVDKYCIDNLVGLRLGMVDSELVINSNEIILLKIGDKTLINKYIDNQNLDNNSYVGLFEYDKMYLDFKGFNDKFYLHSHYFIKKNDCTLNFMDELSVNNNLVNRQVNILNREEIEDLFNSSNYDSMYVINKSGTVLYANNKLDGSVIDRKLIPSDNDIVDIVLNKEKGKRIFSKIEGLDLDTDKPILNSINEIKDLKIYGSSIWPFSEYSDILILSKDGKFDIKWFDLYFIEKDKFKLTTRDINISNPDMQIIYEYLKNDEIRYIPEPLEFNNDTFTYDEDKYPVLIKK